MKRPLRTSERRLEGNFTHVKQQRGALEQPTALSPPRSVQAETQEKTPVFLGGTGGWVCLFPTS